MAISRVTDQEWTTWQQKKFQTYAAEEPSPLEPYRVKAEQDRFQEMVPTLPNPIEAVHVQAEQDAFARMAAENPLQDVPAPAPADSSQPVPDASDGMAAPSEAPVDPLPPPQVAPVAEDDPVQKTLAYLKGLGGEDEAGVKDVTPEPFDVAAEQQKFLSSVEPLAPKALGAEFPAEARVDEDTPPESNSPDRPPIPWQARLPGGPAVLPFNPASLPSPNDEHHERMRRGESPVQTGQDFANEGMRLGGDQMSTSPAAVGKVFSLGPDDIGAVGHTVRGTKGMLGDFSALPATGKGTDLVDELGPGVKAAGWGDTPGMSDFSRYMEDKKAEAARRRARGLSSGPRPPMFSRADDLEAEKAAYDAERAALRNAEPPTTKALADEGEEWSEDALFALDDRAEAALVTRDQVLAELAAERAAKRGARAVARTDTTSARPPTDAERAEVLAGLDEMHSQEGLPRAVGPLREPSQADLGGLEYAHRQANLGLSGDDLPDVDLPPERVAWWHKAGRSARGLLASQFGETGKEIADRAWKMREDYETLMAEWVKSTPTSRKGFTPAMHAELADVLENKATSANPLVNKAADEYRALFDEGYEMARKTGVDVAQKVEHYYPHTWKESLSKQIRNSHRRKEMQEHLIATGQAADQGEANAILRAQTEWQQARDTGQRWDAATRKWVPADEGFGFRRHGNLEVERETDLPGYEKSQAAIDKHLMGVARRIYEAAHFGPQGEIGTAMMRDLAAQGYDMDTAKAAVRVAMGTGHNDRTLSALSRGLRYFNTISKLELAVIGNATQTMTNTAPVVGAQRTLKAMYQAVKDPEARDFIQRTGVTIEAILREIQEGGGWSTRVTGGALPGFKQVEGGNRGVAALAGRDFARDMAERATRGHAQARRALTKMGLDADAIVKRGGELTDDEEIAAARNIVERTQFRVGEMDLPMWASHPVGRMVAQFRSFGYKQSQFVWNEIIKEAKNGNVAPLLRFLVLAPIAGFIGTEGRNIIAGRDSEEDPVKRGAQYLAGPLGLVADAQRAFMPINADRLPADKRAAMASGFVLGPSFGTMSDAVRLGANAAMATGDEDGSKQQEGHVRSAKRIALENVPLAGAVLPNRLFPYEKEYVAGGGRDTRRDVRRDSRDTRRDVKR